MEEINYKERVTRRVREEYGQFISQQLAEKDTQKVINNAFMIHFYSAMYGYFTNKRDCNLNEKEFESLDSVGSNPLFYMFQDFRDRDYECVHTTEAAENFAKSFIEEWENTIRLADENNGKGIVSFVKRCVDSEFRFYRMEEERKPAKIVFDDCYEISFYAQVRDYLCDCDDAEKLEPIHYRALSEDGNNILALLYDYYKKDGSASITDWSDIHDMIRKYNEKFHQGILRKEGEMEIE